LGGNGTNTAYATVTATNGNLHIDAATGYSLFLNYYHNGTIYLNGTTYYISSNGSYYNGTSQASNSLVNNASTGNILVYPVSAAWAEGISFIMPTTSLWGGLRWRRERSGYDGNWAVGYTGLDATDDLVFVANNGGTQVNDILRLTKAGAVSMAGTLYVSSSFTAIGVGDFGPDSGGNNGIGIHYGSSSYGRIRFYQDGSNHSTIHSFGSSWGGGVSVGCINIDGQSGVTIGAWNDHDMKVNRGGGTTVRSLTASGDICAYSDARVKENVKTIENALSKVMSLRGVSYNRSDSDDKKTKIGVIAQETLPIVPEVVNQDISGMYNVAYGNLGGLFIEAFKEQQNEIQELKKLVNQLLNI
jgi:hypothetical protein